MMKQRAILPVLLSGLLLAAPALAQMPGGRQMPGGGGPPNQFGFPGGRAPFTAGTVTAVDAAANTITLTTQNGDSQVVKVADGAQVVTQKTVTISDLKVGDTVAVQGAPTGITASSVTGGTPPAGLPGAPGAGRGPGVMMGAATGGGAAANPSPTNAGSAQASGTIKTLPTASDPHMAISLGSDAVLYVKVAVDAKVTQYAAETLADIKAGDRVVATGMQGNDGTLTATTVGVNWPQGGFGGRGGFGGGFGRPRQAFAAGGGFNGGGNGGANANDVTNGNGGFGGPPPDGAGGFGGPPPDDGGNGGPPPGGFDGPPPPMDGGQ